MFSHSAHFHILILLFIAIYYLNMSIQISCMHIGYMVPPYQNSFCSLIRCNLAPIIYLPNMTIYFKFSMIVWQFFAPSWLPLLSLPLSVPLFISFFNITDWKTGRISKNINDMGGSWDKINCKIKILIVTQLLWNFFETKLKPNLLFRNVV